jgi:peptide/nickel transport system permease protein/oligopeptide transport system permease protein
MSHPTPPRLLPALWRDPLLRVSGLFLVVLVLTALFGPMLSSYTYDEITPQQFQPPSWTHWCGTDLHGRDLLVRLLQGARVSLLVGLIGATVSLTIGVTYGGVAGYVGGRCDQIMMRLVDILYSLPRLVFIIVLIAAMEKRLTTTLSEWGWISLAPHARMLLLFAGLGCVEWLTMARIVRGQVLVLKELAFVQAAKVLGQSTPRILWQHLRPNVTGLILVYLTLTIPVVMLEEAFLSFLGLGVQAPAASWGSLISDSAGLINPLKIYWWLLVFPAAAMSLTLLALNFLGDGLRDYLDPRHRAKK